MKAEKSIVISIFTFTSKYLEYALLLKQHRMKGRDFEITILTDANRVHANSSKIEVKKQQQQQPRHQPLSLSAFVVSPPPVTTAPARDGGHRLQETNKAVRSAPPSATSVIDDVMAEIGMDDDFSPPIPLAPAGAANTPATAPMDQPPSDPTVASTNYRTMTQNEFFLEHMLGLETKTATTSTTTIVHFADDDASESRVIDRYLGRISARTNADFHGKVRFVRLNGKLAPFVAPKLGIKRFPCIASMKPNGQIQQKLSDFHVTGLFQEEEVAEPQHSSTTYSSSLGDDLVYLQNWIFQQQAKNGGN